MWLYTPDRYFWWVLWPDDPDIDFWSRQFNEYVYRLKTEWKILPEHAERFLKAEKGFSPEVLSSLDDFHRNPIIQHLIH